jgi:hypothetical protein
MNIYDFVSGTNKVVKSKSKSKCNRVKTEYIITIMDYLLAAIRLGCVKARPQLFFCTAMFHKEYYKSLVAIY